MKAARKSSSKKKKKKKGSSSSSSSYSDASSSSADSSGDSGDSSGDVKKNKSRKKKSRRDDNDKPSATAKSKAKKENKIQKLTQSMEEAQKGMLEMATKLHELRGLPKAIQKQFKEQQERSEGKDKGKPEPLLTMSQWKELLASNKKATSLPPTPVKAGLFTAAGANIKATPRQILQLASPTPAASTNTTRLCRPLG